MHLLNFHNYRNIYIYTIQSRYLLALNPLRKQPFKVLTAIYISFSVLHVVCDNKNALNWLSGTQLETVRIDI